MRMLVIEDNPDLSEILTRALTDQGYQVDAELDGRKGEERAATGDYDLVLLDIMLPGHDGVELTRNLRRRRVDTPILMLTALADTEDKIAGLDAGADDYLTKPFEVEELLARVRALLRRGTEDEGVVLRVADLELDLLQRVARRGGQEIGLTAREFALLEHLMRNRDRVQTRAMIGEKVWGLTFEDESNVIEVYVSRLRGKIDRDHDLPLLHTVIGTGYVLSETGPPAA